MAGRSKSRPLELRFICNLNLQSKADAWSLLRDISAIYRGMTDWAQGQVFTLSDRVGDSLQLPKILTLCLRTPLNFCAYYDYAVISTGFVNSYLSSIVDNV